MASALDVLRANLLSPTVLAFVLGVLAATPAAAAPPAPRVPVIIDTDIGDDIDDTWALALALKSPELDVKLVVTDFGNTEHRARIVARVLEVAGREDVPIGIGVKESDKAIPQGDWVKEYDLGQYRGRVLKDGVQALVDTVMASRAPMTLIAIGPPTNLKAALEREPRLAGKLRLAGMYGSLRRGSGGKPTPEPEWNVRTRVPAARALLGAAWAETALTPLDTCGLVRLKGERYARVRDSRDPLARAVVEAYRAWCPHQDACRGDPEHVATKSTTLYDTVAVYLAISSDLVKTEALGVRVTDEGMTVPDPAARALTWATEWRDLGAFEEWLTARLTAPTPPR